MTNSVLKKRIIMTRHGQGEHNVDDKHDIRDAPLTDLGREQCHQLHEKTKSTIQQEAQLVVVSPLRRTMETMLLSYPTLIKRLEKEGKAPIILDLVQEVSDLSCDTPTYPLECLKHAQDGIFAHLDFKGLSPKYASKTGIYHPSRIGERAKAVRKWLRQREEDTIVVVAHGDVMGWIVDGEVETDRSWYNCETKIFRFETEDDDDAVLVDARDDEGIKPLDETV